MYAVDDIRIRARAEQVSDWEAREVIMWCRDFARDCIWADIDSDEIDTLPLPDLLRACDRHISGGIAGVLAEVRRYAEDFQPATH